MRSEREIRERRDQLKDVLSMPGTIPGEEILLGHMVILSWVLGEGFEDMDKCFDVAKEGSELWRGRN